MTYSLERTIYSGESPETVAGEGKEIPSFETAINKMLSDMGLEINWETLEGQIAKLGKPVREICGLSSPERR